VKPIVPTVRNKAADDQGLKNRQIPKLYTIENGN